MKTKNLLAIATTLSVLLSSCSRREHNPQLLSPVPVTVHVDGFSVSQSDLPATKGFQSAASYDGINAITLAFYQGSTAVEQITQLKNDQTTYTTFGDFSTTLPLGSYTLVAIAYTAKEEYPFTLTSPTQAEYTGAHAYETFACCQPLNIADVTPFNLEVQLERINTQLRVVSTDGKAANVTNVRMILSAGGRSFSPSTGLAISDAGFENTVKSSYSTGAATTSSTVFFLATDRQDIDVTIQTLDADGNTLFSKTIPNVSFQRNRLTTIRGNMYSADASGSFQLDTDWITAGQDITF